MIVILHFISSLFFYPYNLYCIGCKVMFIVCDILIILFWLIFANCKKRKDSLETRVGLLIFSIEPEICGVAIKRI